MKKFRLSRLRLAPLENKILESMQMSYGNTDLDQIKDHNRCAVSSEKIIEMEGGSGIKRIDHGNWTKINNISIITKQHTHFRWEV